MTEFEQIDKDIDIRGSADSAKMNSHPVRRKVPGIIWIISIFVITLIVILVLPTDESGAFITAISPEELELRDLMCSFAGEIHEYVRLNEKLPLIPGDMEIPSQHFVFTAEDESYWSLSSGDTLIYDCDMDPAAFASGDI